MYKFVFFLSLSSILFFLINCGEKKTTITETTFTKEDSLTERYLNLQDSVLNTWHQMIKDDNQKLKTMEYLLHELLIGKQVTEEVVTEFSERLTQLSRIRFTQKTMANLDVVEEYDFASDSFISELISLTTSSANYEENTTLQNLVSMIEEADQRVYNYRTEYDIAARKYNEFLDTNKEFIKTIDPNAQLEKKPLFDIPLDE